jgi:hypothetical protein
MKKLTKIPVMWLCCTLLFLPFLVAGPASAQCTMISAQFDAAVASCGAADLDCFVSLAKSNLSCAANIAWYYMIVYAPEDPTPVLDSFLNALPYSSALSDELSFAINAAYLANRNEQTAGSRTSANEYPYRTSDNEQSYGK